MSNNALKLDDNQRTALAVMLCILVFVFWSQWTMVPPPRAPQSGTNNSQAVETTPTTASVNQNSTGTTTPASNNGVNVAAGQPNAAQTSLNQLPTVEDLQRAKKLRITTPLIELTINLLGGRLENYRLLKYRDHLNSETPLDLVHIGTGTALPLGITFPSGSDATLPYELVQSSIPYDTQQTLSLKPEEQLELTLQAQLPSGGTLQKRLSLRGNSYAVGVTGSVDGGNATTTPVAVEWVQRVSAEEQSDRYVLRQFSTLGADNKIHSVRLHDAVATFTETGALQWTGISDPYFLRAFVVAGGAILYGRQNRHEENFSLQVTNQGASAQTIVYLGPKDENSLNAVDPRLDRSIDLGWFTFLAKPLLSIIRFFYHILGNYGLAIILLTLLIKTIFLPLNMASLKSMKAMQEIQPELQALKERIKDPTELNAQVRQLFVKKGVNPMGGCLPIMVQIPVFLGLYNALLNSIEMRHAPFALWIHDLSAPEYLHLMGVGIPVMLLLMALSMMIQQWTNPTPTADPTQKKVMMLMPVIFAVMFIVIPMPAGLVLYWLVNNVISIVQQMYLKKGSTTTALNATVFTSLAIFILGFALTKL